MTKIAADANAGGSRGLTSSLSRSATFLFALITLVVAGGAGLVLSLVQQANDHARMTLQLETRNAALILELSVLQKQIELDVAQVQQFLSDYSATRGQDGKDDGLKEAERNATAFATHVAAAKQAARTFGSDELERVLSSVERQFATFYSRGVEMAKVYADQGTHAGNKLMTQFDDVATNMLSRLEETQKTLSAARDQRAKELRDEEHSLEVLRSRVMLVSLICGLLTVLTCLSGIVVVRRYLVRPISHITEAFRRLSSGDTSQEVAHTARGDEIGALINAYRDFRAIVIAADRARLAAEEQDQHLAQVRESHEAERAAQAQDLEAATTALGAALHRLSEGDVAYRIETAFVGDLDRLRGDFNRSMDKLQGSLQTVMASSAAIRTGSQELQTAADDTSRRTEQQAASLEQTAAALDQINTTVRKTAEGAGQARAIVTNARAHADRSGEVVGRTMKAMEGISDSAQKITQIIGVIDEIAFQTNLLALNAGVEAARAGDAGKGFAVVASEVRALAQRSADAAKEIKALITMSAAQVSSGVDLVGETARTLEQIMAQVSQVSDVVLQIATSAEDQAASLAEVSTAMSHMDQTTQQNAAMVEESTAATHSLVKEVDQLSRVLSQFRLDAAAGQRPTALPRPGTMASARTIPASRAATARKLQPATDSETWSDF